MSHPHTKVGAYVYWVQPTLIMCIDVVSSCTHLPTSNPMLAETPLQSHFAHKSAVIFTPNFASKKHIDSQDTFQTSLIHLGQLQSWQMGQRRGETSQPFPKSGLNIEASPAHWTPSWSSWSSCFSSFMILSLGWIGSLEPQWFELFHPAMSPSVSSPNPQNKNCWWQKMQLTCSHPIFKPTHLYLHLHTYGSFLNHGGCPMDVGYPHDSHDPSPS